jgi:glycosyltransferase involved in cell wall biosynthesis
MKISVIIPNYNYARFLPKAIESVLNQTFRNFEIIVVDNDSNDDSLIVLDKYPEVRVISQKNQGQARSRNVGVENSSGEFLAFLDADDFWHPEKLEKQIHMVDAGFQFVTCSVFYVNEKGDNVRAFFYSDRRMDFNNLAYTQPGVSIIEAGESSILVSKKLFHQMGGFDTKLDSSSGWDFFRRCAKSVPFGVVNEPLVYYRVHNNSLSRNSGRNISEFVLSYRKLLSEGNFGFFKECILAIRVDYLHAKSLFKYHSKIIAFILFPFHLTTMFYFLFRIKKFGQSILERD